MPANAHSAAQRPAKPVLARGVPLGRARTRSGAVRLALRFLCPIEQRLVDAGFRLRAHEGRTCFRVTLAK